MIWRPWRPTEVESIAAVVHLRATAAKFIPLEIGPVATSHRSHMTVPHVQGLLPARQRIPTLTRQAF